MPRPITAGRGGRRGRRRKGRRDDLDTKYLIGKPPSLRRRWCSHHPPGPSRTGALRIGRWPRWLASSAALEARDREALFCRCSRPRWPGTFISSAQRRPSSGPRFLRFLDAYRKRTVSARRVRTEMTALSSPSASDQWAFSRPRLRRKAMTALAGFDAEAGRGNRRARASGRTNLPSFYMSDCAGGLSPDDHRRRTARDGVRLLRSSQTLAERNGPSTGPLGGACRRADRRRSSPRPPTDGLRRDGESAGARALLRLLLPRA